MVNPNQKIIELEQKLAIKEETIAELTKKNEALSKENTDLKQKLAKQEENGLWVSEEQWNEIEKWMTLINNEISEAKVEINK